jgi:hypothetical protein
MTADIVNLRRARKAKARTQADAAASENRVKFGQPKGERHLRAAQDTLAAKRHEAHRLASPAPTDAGSGDAASDPDKPS